METKISGIDLQTRNYPERTTIQKRFNDLDGLRHVNNGVQQSFFDIGRANYLKRIYGEKFYCNSQVLLVASYKTDFLLQIRFEDEVEVCSSVYYIGNKSVRMMQIIRGLSDGKIYTMSDSTMVAVDYASGKSIPLPEAWIEKIKEIEKYDSFI